MTTRPLSPSLVEPTLPESSIHRRFFLAAMVLILTAGASWGAWLLWQIGFAANFTGISLHHVNAHGHAQIYGWVGLFIMGAGYATLPRLWNTQIRAPRLAMVTFGLMLFGIITRTAGMTAAGAHPCALHLAMIGGTAEIASLLLFSARLFVTFLRSNAFLTASNAFILTALLWLNLQTIVDVWHTFTTMTATTRDELLWYVATYQAPLRDLQIHGLAMFMILGVSLRLLPELFSLPIVSTRRAWCAYGLLTSAVMGEVAIFVTYRWMHQHWIAALLMIPWIMLSVGVLLIALPWHLWRPIPTSHRSNKFIRIAYLWLAISLVMLLLLPVYQSISGIAFSHAYYGAIRHAITVGFISMMILGMSSRLVPALGGRSTEPLSPLTATFILVNLGCFLRVSLQTLTDWHPGFFAAVGVSGVLEVIGIALWVVNLAPMLLSRPAKAPEPSALEYALPEGAATR